MYHRRECQTSLTVRTRVHSVEIKEVIQKLIAIKRLGEDREYKDGGIIECNHIET